MQFDFNLSPSPSPSPLPLRQEFDFLSSLSDYDLLIETKSAIKTEREATAVVVRYFKEINERELYLKHACSSLFQFATEKLGYCAGSAQLRINAMRLIEALPETEQKIKSGELSLTAAAKVQSFIMLEKKAKRHISTEQKREIVNACIAKSTREVERELAKRNPEIAKVEFVKPVGRDRFQVSFSISEETEEKMKKLKSLFAHTNPHMTTEELFEKLIELGLDKFDPARKAARALKRTDDRVITSDKKGKRTHEAHTLYAPETQSAPVQRYAPGTRSAKSESLHAHEIHPAQPLHARETPERTRYVPAEEKHQVWMRNQNGGCEFETDFGERCGSQQALQIDHVDGFARGGSHDVENLRVVCAKHNCFLWRSDFKICSLV